MATLPQDPIPERVVNVYVSREIAGDLAKMQKVTAQLLGKLGCGGCHSGLILNYHTMRAFAVDPKTLEPVAFGH